MKRPRRFEARWRGRRWCTWSAEAQGSCRRVSVGMSIKVAQTAQHCQRRLIWAMARLAGERERLQWRQTQLFQGGVVPPENADTKSEGAQPPQCAQPAQAVLLYLALEMLQMRQKSQTHQITFAQSTITEMQLPQHDAIDTETIAAAAGEVPAGRLTAQSQLLADDSGTVFGIELQHFELGRESDGAREGRMRWTLIDNGCCSAELAKTAADAARAANRRSAPVFAHTLIFRAR